MLSPDTPITTANDDKLGRKTFAQAFSKTLAGFSEEDSFVIGIHGRWGTGKSSILNLLVEQIEADNRARKEADKLHIMRFNPWNFSDQNQLVFQFLRQFRAQLKDKKLFGSLMSSLDDYAEALAPPLELLPYGSVISSGLKGMQRLLDSTKDVNVLFERIGAESKKLRRRTVVLIDDIDRLTAIETRQIFQLVKLTARFPYVIYVLAFDRDAVAKVLEEQGIGSGNDYLEKIVQVSFDVPPISEIGLTAFITSALDDLLKKYPPAHFDSTRFGNLFHAGLRKRFGSLRDVRRYINGLEFTMALMAGELNAVDIIGVEGLRLFYPKTFGAVRANKEIFAGHVDPSVARSAKSYTEQVNHLLESTQELSEDLKDQLLELFPRLAFAWGQTSYGHEWETEWEKTYRIASKRYFDSYFQLALSESEISFTEISSFIADAKNAQKLKDLLAGWMRTGKLENAVASVRYRLGEIDQANLKNLLDAFLAVAENASEKGVIFAGQIPEYWHVKWAIFDVLKAIPLEQRVSSLKETFSSSSSLKTMINVTALIEKSKEENAQQYGEFSIGDLDEIKTIVVARIREGALKPELLFVNPSLPLILAMWKKWGTNAEEVERFFSEVIESDQNFISFLDSLIYQTHSTVGRVVDTRSRLSMSSLSQWVNLSDAGDRIKKIFQGTPTRHERQILELALSELQRFKKKAVTPEQYDSGRFFDDIRE